MTSRLRAMATAAVIATGFVGAAHANYTVHVLHINDLHSRVGQSTGTTQLAMPTAKPGKCFGGVARVATKINELRDALTAAGENVIVLDAGDQFQGSLMYTTYSAAEAEFMNAIGFDAMAVGNHEFDDGPGKLAEFVDFPVLSNLDLSVKGAEWKVVNHVILDVGGEKIGIVSALAVDTVDTSSPDVVFQDEIDSLKADVAALKQKASTR